MELERGGRAGEARLQPACDDLVDLVAAVVGHAKPVEEIVAQGTACTEILSLEACMILALTIAADVSFAVSPSMKDRSILTLSKGYICKVDNDE